MTSRQLREPDDLSLLLHRLNWIRLEDDLTFTQLGLRVGVDGTLLSRLMKVDHPSAFDRTTHKIRKFVEAWEREHPSSMPEASLTGRDRAQV